MSLLYVLFFFQKRGNYSRWDIIQGGILIKEIRYQYYLEDPRKLGLNPIFRMIKSYFHLVNHLFLDKPEKEEIITKNEFKYPAGCKKDECQYKATWETNDNDEIAFTVIGQTGEDQWIGIGFSTNQVMPETDIVLGYFDLEGNGVVKDFFANNYIPPKEDESQDIFDTSIERLDGITTLKFKRSISSSDEVRFHRFLF